MARAEVHFDRSGAMKRVSKATEEAIAALALQIEAQTKRNIQENGQIDTGFMLNSTFTITAKGQQGEMWGDGTYTGKKSGRTEEHRAVRNQSLGGADAAVGVGAAYAIYQESKNSFLFRAGEQVCKQAGGVMEPVYQKEIGK